jgi:hypothetical protein
LRRSSLAALLLAATLAAPVPALAQVLPTATPAPADGWVSAFPRGGEVFTPMIADPREIQLGADYYRRQGENDADVSLGHSWGLARWRTGLLSDWLWQVDIEGMAYTRFQIGGGINEFETIDFFANLPVEVRKGPFSFKAELFHQSSHLGDDYIRDTGEFGYRYSVEGARGLASIDLFRYARVYGGATWLIHSIPAPQRWALQSGLELASADLHWSSRVSTRVFVAEDVQSHENVQWNVNSNTLAGLKIGFPESPRAMRVQFGYFIGHSPFGEFYAQKEHYADFGISLDL